MNRIKIFTIIVFFLVSFTQVYGDTDLTMDVEVGFDGKCKLNGLNPVKIAMLSKNRDINGNLLLKIDDRSYKSPISLPGGTKKAVEFSIPIFKGNTSMKISFRSEEDIILNKDITPKIINSSSMLIGLLSETPEKLYYIKNIKPYFLENSHVEIINLDENIDYSLDELDNINVIIIDNFNIDALTKENQEILLKWINKGGLTLVGTGEFHYKTKTGVFSKINDVEQMGSGAIVALPNNLIKEKDSKLIQDTIEKYITSKGLEAVMNENYLHKKAQASKELQFISDHLFKATGDRLLFLTILILTYIILIFGIFFWKTRTKGTTFAVVTGVSLIFYVLAWSGGLQSSKVVFSSIILHEEDTTSFSLTNIYPYKEDVMSIDISATSFAKELTNSKYVLDPIDKQIIYHDTRPHYLFIKEVYNREKLKLNLELNEDMISGELINPLSDKLYNTFLVIGDTAVPLGDIKSKERVKIQYKLDHNLFNLSDYNYIAQMSKVAGLDTYKKGLLEYYLSQIKSKGIKCKIVGFTQTEKNIAISGKSQKAKSLSLNVYPVNIISGTDEISLPPQFIEPVSYHNKELSKKVQNEYTLNKDDELLLYYVIPSSTRPNNISVYTKIEGGEMEINIYNHHKGIWEKLNSEMLMGDNLRNYIKNGPLSLKIEGEGRLIIPQIAVKGKINSGDELYE